jgi:hypothetical protein
LLDLGESGLEKPADVVRAELAGAVPRLQRDSDELRRVAVVERPGRGRRLR